MSTPSRLRVRRLLRPPCLALLAAQPFAAMLAHASEVPKIEQTQLAQGAAIEARLGAFFHGIQGREARTLNLSGEILLPRPTFAGDLAWKALLPRLALGGAVNLQQRTHHVHLSLVWQADLTRHVFAEASVGLAAHSGHARASRWRDAMGCSGAFRESVGLGYRIDARWQLIASVEHLSNGGLCRQNRGLTNLGARVGYVF